MLLNIKRVPAPKKYSGRLIQIQGKKYSVSNNQPLIFSKHKVILQQLDEKLGTMVNVDPVEMDLQVFNEHLLLPGALIGYF